MPYDAARDASPLTRAQIRHLAATAARELAWAAGAARREAAGWRRRALAIPDPTLRAGALHSLDHKAGFVHGAALFATLPRRRSRPLVRALVAYELIIDYLDEVHERHPTVANGLRLHRALADAVSLEQPGCGYYRHHPTGDDGGFLLALVDACRDGCAQLPAFDRVEQAVAAAARRSAVLGLNHADDPLARDRLLQEWAARERPSSALAWFESSAAASASLSVLALLAAAADPPDGRGLAQVEAAYDPWPLLTATMLDSYADLAADEASGAHSYLLHYDSHAAAVARLHECVSTSMRLARALPDGGRHAVVVGCMIALFLSSDGANSPDLRETTRALARSGGSLVRLLVPILRIWRRVHRQSS